MLDNGVYGQSNGSSELDGINYTPTVSLGRAPVHTATQAGTFVNKVIAYEKYERPDGTALDQDWPKRVVLVSENWDWNWGGRLKIEPSGNNPPSDDGYHHMAGQNHSLIKLKEMHDWNWSLFASLSESDVRLLPYRTDAATAGRGWYFARSSSDLSPNSYFITLPFGTMLSFPLPSQWIAVYGTAEELTPASYILNSIQLDGSLADQEELRLQMHQQMPGFNLVRRLYEDEADMDSAAVAAAPLDHLSTEGMRNALNAGPHIVSLSGHGNNWGCCKLGQDVADSLTNGYHTFIAYADSCLTNQFDDNAMAMSEHLLNNPPWRRGRLYRQHSLLLDRCW